MQNAKCKKNLESRIWNLQWEYRIENIILKFQF